MGRRIELPKLPAGQPQEQLQALYSYLYQMAEALNNNLAEIGNGGFTDEEMVVVREITGQTETADGMAEAETLKSLIIKTAKLIKSEIDEYNLKLIGTYEAEGKLGRYVRKTRLDVDVTPTGITQNYTFQDIIQGLKTYEVNAKNYIKTGLLRTVSSVPVYGVAIGKDVVTFSNDGTETYNDGNKVAELTADELSFWQNGNKVASYTGTAITLYSGNSKRVQIDGDGVTFYNGSTKLAELLATALKFYYNGTLRTQMDTDGVKIYDGSTLLMQITGTRISFYQGGNEKLYIQNGEIHANANINISSSSNLIKIAGMEFDYEGMKKEVGTTGEYTGFIPQTSGFFITNVRAGYGFDRTISGEYACVFGIKREYGATAELILKNNGNSNQCVDFYPDTFGDYKGVNLGGSSSFEHFKNVYANNYYYTTLNQESSRDIKHDIREMESRGEQIDRLRPVTFVYDEDPEEKTRAGLIYEETEPVLPEICTGDEGDKAINYVELIPMLLKEIQDLRARVKALEEGGNENG